MILEVGSSNYFDRKKTSSESILAAKLSYVIPTQMYLICHGSIVLIRKPGNKIRAHLEKVEASVNENPNGEAQASKTPKPQTPKMEN